MEKFCNKQWKRLEANNYNITCMNSPIISFVYKMSFSVLSG